MSGPLPNEDPKHNTKIEKELEPVKPANEFLDVELGETPYGVKKGEKELENNIEGVKLGENTYGVNKGEK